MLDDELSGKQWLVGDKCSAADLSYVPFHGRIDFIMGKDKPDSKSFVLFTCDVLHGGMLIYSTLVENDFPNVDAWYKRMLERPKVQKAEEDRIAAFEQALSRDAGLRKRLGQQ